ncbi:MAG: molybdopterin molybdotransferase MoeA [Dehalococcoidia bacterium]|nr:MAG: molybdopterin molybdotransferase MoeA [Dehalococcoidia bacterium]
MKPFGKLISFDKALDIAKRNANPITRIERVSLEESLGRVLAEDIIAEHNTPPFNRVAVDGFAVIAADTFRSSRQNPKTLEIVDVIYAGARPEKEVRAGTCIQVSTGVKMPNGADSVVMVEDIKFENNNIKVVKPIYPGANVAPIGEDVKKGELILKKGQLITPGNLGILASQGMENVTVYEKPKVAIIPTGDEITPIGQKLEETHIYDINSHTVSAIVNQNGGIAIRFAIISDTQESLKNAMIKALEADMVVFTGGSSVGERDILADVLDKEGEVLFHGIQIKPGKPTLFAVVDDKPFWGMPGYPTSCLINAYLLLIPTIRKIARLPLARKIEVPAKLAENVSGSIGRKQFLPVYLEGDMAVPLFKESGAITGTAKADGFIVVPENIDMIREGEVATVILFNDIV